MVNNNKILTVSYGTFSCTLEGFEDAFGTMKVIAEYFRDLAADDRFFGAEPPQIDAEMLAHIAQREISRQVEARRDDTGIILRASEYHGTAPAAPAASPSHTSQTPVPNTPTLAPTPMPTPTPKAMPEPTVAAPAAMPLAEAEEVAPQPAPEPDSIAAKLQRIRAVVSRAEPQPAQETEDDYGTDLLVGTVSDLSEALAIDDVAEAEAAAPQPATPDEIGQALARIDAASTPRDMAVPDDVDLSELSTGQDLHGYDEHYEPEDEAVIALSVLSQVRVDPTPDTVTFDASAETGEDDAETTPDADLAEEENPEDTFGTADLADTPDMETGATDADEAVAEPEDRGDGDGLFDDPDAPENFGLDPIAAVMAADAPEMGAEETDAEDEEIVNLLDSDEDTPRVLRMSRSELDAALAAGEIEELTDEAEADEAIADEDLPEDDIDTSLFALDDDEDEDGDAEDMPASTLSGEDEADLMRELAAVQAQFAATEPEVAAAEPTEAAAPEDDYAEAHHSTAHRIRQDATPAKSEDDLSRLMAAAEEKMEDEQSSTNRATYTQLRAAAAVAAADRAAGRPTQDDAEDGAYRDDLASVVRPRRPVSGSGQRPDRPAGTRPAPLKLVAEQRIDLDTIAKDRGPVRPRRVASEDEDIIADAKSGGFAEFADRMGASDLSELLEAAAAYMSFVEGRNQFSRPQLMNKVRQMEGQEFKREDGLRSFGQLLRDGKIEKTSGGRFTASSDIGFRPDRRAAG